MANNSASDKTFDSAKTFSFEEYQEMFKDWFTIRREDGIIEIRMHTNDGPAQWSYGMHRAWGQLPKMIAQDLENQVLIFTGTGDKWLTFPEHDYGNNGLLKEDPRSYARRTYDDWYMDGSRAIKAFLYDLQIPTIAAINGPSLLGHFECALACDVTFCTPDTKIYDSHFKLDLVPGDGQYFAIRHCIGDKRSNLMLYECQDIDAQKAVEWGMVNEVVDRDKLMDRAWDCARTIMKQSYHTRRLTHHAMTDQWRRDGIMDIDSQYAYQGWAASMISPEKGLKTAGESKE